MLIPTLVRHDCAVPSTRRSGAEDLWCLRLNLAWLRYSKSRQRGNKISETGSKSSVEDRDTERREPTGMPPLPCQQRLSDISTDTEGTEGIRGSREPKNKGRSFSTAQPAYADPGRQWSTRPEVYCRLGLSRAGAYARGGSFRKGEGGEREGSRRHSATLYPVIPARVFSYAEPARRTVGQCNCLLPLTAIQIGYKDSQSINRYRTTSARQPLPSPCPLVQKADTAREKENGIVVPVRCSVVGISN